MTQPEYPPKMEHYKRYRRIVEDFDDFIRCLSTFLPTYIRINTLKTDKNKLIQHLERRWIHASETPIDCALAVDDREISKTLEYFMGYYYIQDLASIAVAPVLGAVRGEIVLDLCAAPGGKTTHLAQIMENTGLIIANDVNARRLNVLIGHLNRLGVMNTAVTSMHAGNHRYISKADRILIDAPCSSEGIVRRNWGVLERLNLKVIRAMAGLQRRILLSAVERARRGSVIVYSTCTFAPEEDEMVVQEALKTGKVELLDIDVPLRHSPGITRWEDEDGRCYTMDSALSRTVRIYPHQNDTGGMYIAKLQRI